MKELSFDAKEWILLEMLYKGKLRMKVHIKIENAGK